MKYVGLAVPVVVFFVLGVAMLFVWDAAGSFNDFRLMFFTACMFVVGPYALIAWHFVDDETSDSKKNTKQQLLYTFFLSAAIFSAVLVCISIALLLIL